MSKATELKARAEKWLIRRQSLFDRRKDEEKLLEKTRSEQQDIKGAIALLQYVASETNKAREEQTASLATLALKETFTDQDLCLLCEPETYRGHHGVVFKLKDEKTGVEGDPMDSFGGGPASLLGLILQAISVSRQPGMSKVLILDEPVAQISAGYQEAAGRLLRKLCEPPPEGPGFNMLVITHLDSIADAAHRRYRATKSEDGKALVLTEEITDQGE
jgi:DNA repair ATPase RecN